jgi:UDP-3-O-[3-hydroxymyristoyl] glucosamine N-acyltransferase
VSIGAHSVLGGPGFAYTAGAKGPERLHHLGRVVLEDDVHVGAGCTIDRARFHETRLGRQTALDNMVHIAHNVTIGPRTFLAAQCGIAGSARIGADCEIGGQVGFGDQCEVGDRCRIAGGSGVTRKYGDDLTLFWYPAFERTEAFRMIARLRKLAVREG